LIAAAQKVEHYEIATYGCARTYAELLDDTNASELLQQTLDEEKLTDQKLTDLAAEINVEAVEADSEHDNGSISRSSSKKRAYKQ
jgi:ferritin-like metal-binding protein YciE